MFAELEEAVEALESLVKDLEPGILDASGARRALEAFSRAKRLASAGEALCARRVEETFVAGSAHRSPASEIALATGESLGAAMGTLAMARRMESLPHLEQAMRSGEVSLPKAKEIASAVAASPSVEAELVRAAPGMELRDLRRRCERLRARANSAKEESARLEAIRRSRYLHTWRDPDGATRLDARLAPDDGAAVLAAISTERDRVFKDARAQGRQESYDAYSADALVSLITGSSGGSSSPGPRAQVSVVVDASALRRGYAEGEERCEIPGVGPVPVATARELLGDAWLRLVVTKGTDVASICHVGRTMPAHLRSALLARDEECAVPGCHVSSGLEIDHNLAIEDGGPTAASNLERLCKYHHNLKTHHGYRLEGGPGNWVWLAPGEEGPGTGPPPAEDDPPPTLFDTG